MPKNKAAQQLGRKGGKANTPDQKKSRSANLEAARAKRWPKKEDAARAANAVKARLARATKAANAKENQS